MAKKSKTDAVVPTKEQLEAICANVLDKRANVYHVAKEILGRDVGEEIFDQLRQSCGIFKCENCDYWHPTSDEALEDWCQGCLDEDDSDADE